MGFIFGLLIGCIISICVPQNTITELIKNKVLELIKKVIAKINK
jgi:uncharacterized membrane protein YraQ (UPF0718 family)